ncbi:MAG: hypothetical protein IKP12_05500 [Acholeplasmatales bacterium]|nr:hypothetical protein [Acholeplasmatales bacterium]
MVHNKRVSNVLIIIFNLYLYYYAYRYILRYNDSETSPTYSDTPLILQIGKYILLVLLIAVFLLYTFKKKVKIRGRKVLVFIAFLVLILQEIYCFILDKNSNQLTFSLCLIPPFLMLLFNEQIDYNAFDKSIEIFVYISIAYEILQVLLFIGFNRLPALAYDTGVFTDVRYGSVWDDPNGFALFTIFLIPYSLYKFKGLKRIIILVLLLGMLGLTFSLTAIAVAVVIAFIALVSSILKNTKRSIWIYIVTLTTIILGIIAALTKIDSFLVFMDSKQGSILGHLESFKLTGFTIYQFLGIIPKAIDAESGAIKLLYIGGVLHFIVFFILSICALVRLRILSKNSNNPGIYKAMFWYVLGFMIGCINLPYMYIFVTFGIYGMFIGIAYMPLKNNAIKEGEDLNE